MKKKIHLKKDAYLVIIILAIVLLSIAGFGYAFLKFKPLEKCLEITAIENNQTVKENMELNELYNYTFKVKNSCAQKVVNISLETLTNSNIKENYLLVNNKILSSYPAKVKTKDNSLSSHLIISDELAKNEEKTYNFQLQVASDINETNLEYQGEFVIN